MKLLEAKCAASFKRGEMCVGRNVGHSLLHPESRQGRN